MSLEIIDLAMILGYFLDINTNIGELNEMKKEPISTQFYEVNPHTMIIFPKKSGSIVYSEIYEVDSQYTSKFTPFELIKTSCNFFG
ncbi:competence transcription factor ComK, partial [Listeria ivanovii FSL F6-596]